MPVLPVVYRSTPYYGGLIRYVKPRGLDVYGKPIAGDDDHADLPARVRTSRIELQEKGGVRAVRDGISVELTKQDWMAINDHVVWQGEEYTIIGIDSREDYRGRTHFVVLSCVKKRGNV